jgi:hypothetical protein
MANTYFWNFPQLEVYNQFAGQEQVVYTIHWTLTGTSDTTPPVSQQIYGSLNVTYTAGDPFTPYADLTYDQVQGWTLDALGQDTVTEMQSNLDTQIANIINPPTANLPPPWAS